MMPIKKFTGDAELEPIYKSLSTNLIGFGKLILPDMFRVKTPDFHYEIGKHFLDKSIDRLNIKAPRGHAKSTLSLLQVLHHIAYDQGRKHIVIVSKTLKHSVALLGLIKEALATENFTQLYGNYTQAQSIKWAEDELILSDSTRILCLGTGQQARGLTYRGQRPTLIILDDPEDENNIRSDAALEQNRRYLLNGLVPALDPLNGRIIVIGTPVHFSCIVMLLEDMKRWKSLSFSAELDPENKLSLWPEWWPWNKLQDEKEDLERIGRLSYYYQEYCCKIIADGTALFSPNDARFYNGSISFIGKYPTLTYHATDRSGKLKTAEFQVPVNIYMGIDPAVSTSATADYSTIVLIAIDHLNNRFVLPYTRQRLSPHNLFNHIINIYKRYRPKRTSIESTAAQENLRDFLQHLADIRIPGITTKHQPKEKKEKRHIDLLQPHFAAHKIHLLPNQTELYDELITHPHSKNDDLIDGLYYANLHAKPCPLKSISEIPNTDNNPDSYHIPWTAA